MLRQLNPSHRKVTMTPDKKLIATIEQLSPADRQALATIITLCEREPESVRGSVFQDKHNRVTKIVRQLFYALRHEHR